MEQQNKETKEQRNKGTKEQRNKEKKFHPIGSGITRSPGLVFIGFNECTKKKDLIKKILLTIHCYAV